MTRRTLPGWTKEEDELWDAARDGKDGEIRRLIDSKRVESWLISSPKNVDPTRGDAVIRSTERTRTAEQAPGRQVGRIQAFRQSLQQIDAWLHR